MHRSELDEYGVCTSCGAEVSTLDRPFTYGDDDLLCFDCATARHGVYDEEHDRWVVAPSVVDLPARPRLG